MICGHCGEEIELGAEQTHCPVCEGPAYLREAYRLDAVVGQGAAGVTYRATRLEDGLTVAVKELPFRRIDSMKTKTLFEREASILQQLDHPGIPSYLDDFTGGVGKNLSLYLVQEFIDGEDLVEEMASRRYREDEVLGMVAELLKILDYLHTLRPAVIHRDIKPRNVMRCRDDGRLVLVDFGAVRDAVKDPDAGGSTVAGTFGYMAPEQFQGRALPASDIYGLGALAVNLLTRRAPDKMLGLGNQLEWEEHVDVHPATRRLLSRMLVVEPEERASDAAALRVDVLDALDEIHQAPQPDASNASQWRAPNAAPGLNARPSLNLPPEPEPLALEGVRPAPLVSSRDAAQKDPDPLGGGASLMLVVVVGIVVVLGIAVVGLVIDLSPDGVAWVEVSNQGTDDRCGGEPCPPVPRGLKKLRFGMTLDEAIEVMPEIAEGQDLANERISPNADYMMSDFRLRSDAAQTVPGTLRSVRTTIGNFGATCELSFAVEDKLSRMFCKIDAFKSMQTHQAAEGAVLRALTHNHGEPMSASVLSNPGMEHFSTLEGGNWRWVDGGASLEFASKFESYKVGITTVTSEMSVLNQSAEHTELLASLQRDADAALAEARRAREVEEERARQQEIERLKRLQNEHGGSIKDDL